MKTLITFGSPHQGVFGVPHCVETTESYLLCSTSSTSPVGLSINPRAIILVAYRGFPFLLFQKDKWGYSCVGLTLP